MSIEAPRQVVTQTALDACDSGRRVMIVDDDESDRWLLARPLTRAGFTVEHAATGPAGLERIGSAPPAMVLLDLNLPGMSGLEVLRAIRETHGPLQLPVVIVTGHHDSERAVEALGLGANDYVTKPVDGPVLVARLQNQLRFANEGAASRRPTVVETGTVLDGRYRLGNTVGIGNFATVYRSRDLATERDVAVKVLRRDGMRDDTQLERLKREAASARRLRHEHAVEVLDFSVTGAGTAYLVMELLQGCTLDDALAAAKHLSARRCLEIVNPVCHVLAKAHDLGIVHRDLKPQNVFLDVTHGPEVVKVLDFGIVKWVGQEASVQTRLDLWAGTPAYASPERLRREPYDGRSDVYSLGVMLYEMLTGVLPFVEEYDDPLRMAMMHLECEPRPIRELDPELSVEVEAVVQRSLAKDPELRPDARAFAAELARAVGGAVTLPPTGWTERPTGDVEAK